MFPKLRLAPWLVRLKFNESPSCPSEMNHRAVTSTEPMGSFLFFSIGPVLLGIQMGTQRTPYHSAAFPIFCETRRLSLPNPESRACGDAGEPALYPGVQVQLFKEGAAHKHFLSKASMLASGLFLQPSSPELVEAINFKHPMSICEPLWAIIYLYIVKGVRCR